MEDKRLVQASELVRIINGKLTMYFYKEIIRQMQQSLNEKMGFDLKVNGIFDEKMEVALSKFK